MAGFFIHPHHFDRTISLALARELFKSSVTQVEVETFSYCNRTCRFCPNSRIDRRSKNIRMDERLYLRIVSDLASVDYDQVITYSRYNEPLADRIILTRLRQAREALPDAILVSNTNGDYLTRTYLDELRDAGLNRLDIQVYVGNNEGFSDAKILTRMVRRLNDLGLPFEFVIAQAGIRYMATVQYEGMEVCSNAWNFEAMGWNRGGLVSGVPSYQRLSPCPVVFQHLYIDYNGSIVPCCNIRSDAPSHRPYVIDALKDGKSLFEAYSNSALVDWRGNLLVFGLKEKPCNTCSYAVFPDTPELRAHFAQLANKLLPRG